MIFSLNFIQKIGTYIRSKILLNNFQIFLFDLNNAPSVSPSQFPSSNENDQQASDSIMIIGISVAAAALGVTLVGVVGCWQYNKYCSSFFSKIHITEDLDV